MSVAFLFELGLLLGSLFIFLQYGSKLIDRVQSLSSIKAIPRLLFACTFAVSVALLEMILFEVSDAMDQR